MKFAVEKKYKMIKKTLVNIFKIKSNMKKHKKMKNVQ